jgi:branched-chain amino acid transport system ATP-binding protein
MLILEGVRAGYGTIEVLKGIDLEVKEGEIVTLIGANGAGKTSTLMCASGVLKLRAGKIWFQQKLLAKLKPNEIVGLGLVQSPEGRKIFPRLTVLENLEMGAFTRRDDVQIRKDIERVYGLFPILGQRRSQAGGTLSGGEQQMLAVGRAMMARPRLLMLDEPSLGLAPLDPARRAERPHGPEARPPRLRHGDRRDHDARHRLHPARRPPRPIRLPRRVIRG